LSNKIEKSTDEQSPSRFNFKKVLKALFALAQSFVFTIGSAVAFRTILLPAFLPYGSACVLSHCLCITSHTAPSYTPVA
jgi:hypothetical protein